MRTTLDIDADVLEVAREIASYRKQSIGKVISEVVRRNLVSELSAREPVVRNGFEVFPKRKGGAPITLEIVNKLRDED